MYHVSTRSKKVVRMHGMDRRIFAGAIMVLGLALSAQSPLAEDRPSARIYSLGGEHVSGIIPDTYTDLTVNPAYACLVDRLTVGYARRSIYDFAPTIPYLSEDTPYRLSYYRNSFMTNEVSVYGMELSSWRAAVFAQWRIGSGQSTVSDFSLYSNSSSAMTQNWDNEDNDFGRIDLMAARAIGDDLVLGFRLQGWGYYKSVSNADSRVEESYLDGSFSELTRERKSQSATSYVGRRTSFDFQTGIMKKSGVEPRSDLVLRASFHPIDYLNQSASLVVDRGYNDLHEINSYAYTKGTWSDERNGNLWTFGLALRHAFGSGIRIYAGGDVSTASYDAEWTTTRTSYSWGYYSGGDAIQTGGFDCDGSFQGASGFLKSGKTFALHRTLDLYLGVHGIFQRKHAEEHPVIEYSYARHDSEDSVRIDQPTSLEYTGTAADIYLPVSIEFRPSSYFSFFSGFTLYGEWYKHVTTQPMPAIFYYNRPLAAVEPGGSIRTSDSSGQLIVPETSVTDWRREFVSGSAVTLGFSFHYGDRFFVDVYSQSEIIPGNLQSANLDLRYVF